MVYFWLILGLVLLVFGGDIMVKGAVVVAKNMGVSTLLIGLTLIGFGTSTPELVTSLLAVFQGAEGIAVGNVVGSSTANILLVLGVAALVRPFRIDIRSFRRDSSFLLGSTLLLVLAIWVGRINFWAGLLMVAGLVFYIWYSYVTDGQRVKKKRKKYGDLPIEIQEIEADLKRINKEVKEEVKIISREGAAVRFMTNAGPLMLVVFGLIFMLLGASLLVDNAIVLARSWGVSETIIGLTIVAVGTSLPELATSVVSSYRHHGSVAFGNVVGSNIYNSLFILGVVALIAPINVPDGMGCDAVIMVLVTLVLIGIAFWKRRLSRLTGIGFLAAYALYVGMMYAG